VTEQRESKTVLHDVDEDGVAILTLNRPERNNAWNREMERTLHDLLEWASVEESVRAIVLTGAGKAFCPGLDSEDLSAASSERTETTEAVRRPILLPALVPKPVVCAINGACAGVGLVVALTADVRFVAEDAKLTTAYSRRGMPAEEAVSWLLPRIVGHATSLDLLLSGRVILGAEAAALGLANWATPRDELLSRATEYARELSKLSSPIAMATAKKQVYGDWEKTMAQSRQEARRHVNALRGSSSDFREGIESFVEKRSPSFAALSEAVDLSDHSM
jgi:enoyl-CoA hydratase/carnithine racemase